MRERTFSGTKMLIGLPLAHYPVLHDLAPGSALLHRLNASGDAAVDRRVSIVVMPKQQWLGSRAYCDFKGGDGELCARKAAKLVRSLAVGGLFSAIVGTVLGPFGKITVTVHSTRACAELNALSP